MIVIDKKSGNILRITDAFKNFKIKKRKKIKPMGFIIGKKNMYLTTVHGRLLIIDIESGTILSTIKIDSNKIARPLVLNRNLFIITDSSIIKLN